mmetsp:Transcript_27148/g.82311  ORF Transcript_27148/g.82311 Transcript_27148/m.82311 type:complete len:85 (-) Transcript_27148:1039-1293(-)
MLLTVNFERRRPRSACNSSSSATSISLGFSLSIQRLHRSTAANPRSSCYSWLGHTVVVAAAPLLGSSKRRHIVMHRLRLASFEV